MLNSNSAASAILFSWVLTLRYMNYHIKWRMDGVSWTIWLHSPAKTVWVTRLQTAQHGTFIINNVTQTRYLAKYSILFSVMHIAVLTNAYEQKRMLIYSDQKFTYRNNLGWRPWIFPSFGFGGGRGDGGGRRVGLVLQWRKKMLFKHK